MKRKRSTDDQDKANIKRQKLISQDEFYASNCSYCGTMIDTWHVHLARFHEECNTCSSPDAIMPRFCSWWKHLRLEHLYKCCKFRTQIFEFENFQLCQNGGHCPGCRAIRISIGHCGTPEPPTGGGIKLFFDFDDRSAPSNQWVRLSVSHKASGRGSSMTIFRDYRRSSVSDEAILREHHLDENDWSRLRKEIGTADQRNVHGISGLKVIDVQEKCIVPASPACEYAALSYVWGTSEAARNSLMATSSNINILETPQGLDSQDVPATVKDAMTACEKLGKQYLWVDRLCILQDGDNSAMINVMDQVYSRAAFTIVASANDDVLRGLPGISRNQIRDFELKVPGWRFQGSYSRNWHGNETKWKWKNRAWTFQEEYFSKKLLFFGERHATIPKRIGFEKDFFAITPDYSCRDLSYTGDKVRAFAGALNSLCNGNHRHGIPFEQFEAALLWAPEYPSKNEEFPSWSWASVRSITYFWYRRKHLGMPIASWAFYSKSTANGIQLTPVVSKPRDCIETWIVPDKKRHDEYAYVSRGFLTSFFLAWKEGCFDALMPPDFEGKETWEQISRAVVSVGDYEHCWKITRPQNLHEEFTEVAAQAGDGDPNRRLLVHTQFATFNLDESQEGRDRPGLFPLFGVDDTLAGWVILDRPSDVQDFPLTKSNGRRRVNVLALAVSQAVKDDAQVFEDLSGIRSWKEATADIFYLDSDGEVSPWDPDSRPPLVMLNIMLVKEAELGQSYRRIGMGKVLLKRWKNGSPQFKVSILE